MALLHVEHRTNDGSFWNAYQAIKHIRYGPDWKANVITPQTRFFSDVKNGVLPAVSWVTPTCAELRSRRLRLE